MVCVISTADVIKVGWSRSILGILRCDINVELNFGLNVDVPLFLHLFVIQVYHVSAVGTIGYKSPEGSIYCIGNSLDIMPPLSTKADIFSFGLLMSLLFLNQEGPKSQLQMAKMLLSVNQTVAPKKSLNMVQRRVLEKHHVRQCRPMEIAVAGVDVEGVLPVSIFHTGVEIFLSGGVSRR